MGSTTEKQEIKTCFIPRQPQGLSNATQLLCMHPSFLAAPHTIVLTLLFLLQNCIRLLFVSVRYLPIPIAQNKQTGVSSSPTNLLFISLSFLFRRPRGIIILLTTPSAHAPLATRKHLGILLSFVNASSIAKTPGIPIASHAN